MPSRASKKTPRVVILSGGSGRTADQLLRAGLAQFPKHEVEFIHQTGVRSIESAIKVVRAAADQGDMICHSIVEPKIRKAVDAETRRLDVPCIDALGPTLALLGDHFDDVPRGQAGLLYEVHREQIDRMDAMDFTLAHDDGKRMHDIKNADVVLVGASRTTKSVTCCYLAFRGLRAANVPLIPGHPLPRELRRLSARRVIGLTMSAAHLESIRQSRLERISDREVPRYANVRDIQQELREIRRAMTDNQWECIDVSYKATEEVASQIAEMLPRRRRRTNKSPAKK